MRLRQGRDDHPSSGVEGSDLSLGLGQDAPAAEDERPQAFPTDACVLDHQRAR